MKFHFLAIQTSHESKLGKRHFHRHVSRGRRDEAPIDDRSSLERKHSFHSLMHIHATDITRNNFAPRAIAVYFCIFCKERERGRERGRERERETKLPQARSRVIGWNWIRKSSGIKNAGNQALRGARRQIKRAISVRLPREKWKCGFTELSQCSKLIVIPPLVKSRAGFIMVQSRF